MRLSMASSKFGHYCGYVVPVCPGRKQDPKSPGRLTCCGGNNNKNFARDPLHSTRPRLYYQPETL